MTDIERLEAEMAAATDPAVVMELWREITALRDAPMPIVSLAPPGELEA